MMGLTSRQLATLARLEAERRRDAEAAERQAWRRREHATREQLARGNALVSEMERLLEAGTDVDALQDAVCGAGPPAPRALGAAVPEPPAGPEPPLNRRQRRALERQRRKTRRRRANRA